MLASARVGKVSRGSHARCVTWPTRPAGYPLVMSVAGSHTTAYSSKRRRQHRANQNSCALFPSRESNIAVNEKLAASDAGQRDAAQVGPRVHGAQRQMPSDALAAVGIGSLMAEQPEVVHADLACEGSTHRIGVGLMEALWMIK